MRLLGEWKLGLENASVSVARISGLLSSSAAFEMILFIIYF